MENLTATTCSPLNYTRAVVFPFFSTPPPQKKKNKNKNKTKKQTQKKIRKIWWLSPSSNDKGRRLYSNL